MYQDRTHIKKFLYPSMMLLSWILGVFIAFYFTFVNGEFVKRVGPKVLCYAFVVSGIVGYGITYLYNRVEKRRGFFPTSTLFNLVFGGLFLAVLYFFMADIYPQAVIFVAYTLFWLASNYLNLVFWKIPASYFDIAENKQYNGPISTGEVVAGIIAYFLIPVFKMQGLWLLVPSVLSLAAFFLLFQVIRIRLSRLPAELQNKPRPAAAAKSTASAESPWDSVYTRLIFGAIFFAIIVQLVVDYALLEATAREFQNQQEVSRYLAKLYMAMRFIELILKLFLSRFVIKEMGIFVGLVSIIAIVGIFVLGGLLSMALSVTGAILIFSSFNKIFERSVFRSIYVPTVNILYQAYPSQTRAVNQNFADGYGKTMGQVIAGVVLWLVVQFVQSFNLKMAIVFALILLMLTVWLMISRHLIGQYRSELNRLIIKMRGDSSGVREEAAGDSGAVSIVASAVPEEAFRQMTGSDAAALSAADGRSLPSALEAYNRYVARHITMRRDERFTDDELQVVRHMNRLAEERGLMAGTVNFHVYCLQYPECWEQSAAVLSRCSYEEVQRGLIYVSEQFGPQALQRLPVLLMRLYMHQLHFERLPQHKRANEAKALCRSERNLYASIVNDTDLQLDKQGLYMSYIQLLQKSIGDFAYVVASLRDIGDEHPLLKRMLESERLQCTQDIVKIIRSVNEKDVFDRIIPMIFRGNRSEEVLAYELLELVLSEQERAWVLPVMREVRHSRIIRKLEMDFPQASLTAEERLLSIIGRNGTQLSELTRLAALSALADRMPMERAVQHMSAMAFYREPYIRHFAHEYLQRKAPAVFAELSRRTGYRLEAHAPLGERMEALKALVGDPDGTMPVAILNVLLTCHLQDPAFPSEGSRLFRLVRNVFRGRRAELDRYRKVFERTMSRSAEEEALRMAV